MPEDKLAKIQVRNIRDLIVKEPAVVKRNAPINEVLEKIIKDTRSRHAYIVDKKNVLIGSIRVNNIIQYLFPTTILLDSSESPHIGSFMEYSSATTAANIMNTNPNFVYEETSLAEMAQIMTREKINELPVVDKDKKIIGEVNILEIIAYYLRMN